MQALTFFFAFVAVLALIGLAAWLVRRFASNRLGTNVNRGRMPRLAVIDAAAVDGRRRLVLVRRDNVEHLLMIGGPTDVVIESHIVRAAHAREQLPPRGGLSGAESLPPPRIAPLPDVPVRPDARSDNEAAKPDVFELPEPTMPELPARPSRPPFPDEGRRPTPFPSERRGEFRNEAPERREPPPAFPPEPFARPEPRHDPRQEPRHDLRGEPRMEPRPERLMPRADAPRPDIPRSDMPRSDVPRSDMPRGEPMREPAMPRQLRPSEPPRPVEPVKTAPMRAPAPERAAAPPPPPSPPQAGPPPALPQQSAEANLAEMAQRLEAALRRPPPGGPPAEASSTAPEPSPLRSAARGEPPVAPAPEPKTNFENLEDEMASLLGRPKSST
jgi:hypothetical protein